MSVRFESIVRPFQEGEVFDARRAPPEQPALDAPETVVFEWGKGIDAHFLRPDPIFEYKTDWTEKARETETVRVTNPDDDSQFVDVERIKRLVMENSKSGQTLEWKLDW